MNVSDDQQLEPSLYSPTNGSHGASGPPYFENEFVDSSSEWMNNFPLAGLEEYDQFSGSSNNSITHTDQDILWPEMSLELPLHESLMDGY